MTSEEFLDHHGVKGQKWGIRNLRERRNATKRAAADKEHHVKSLSDEEINKYIKRLELEKRYKDLSNPQKTAGKKYVHELLQNSGKAATGTVVSATAAFAIKKALTKGTKKVAEKAVEAAA